MNYSSLTYNVHDRIITITLNQPERRNALDDVMIRELTDAFTVAGRSNGARVIILTGAGSAFCAGMDLEYLKKYAQLTHEENLEDARNLMRLLQTISSIKKPVIAALNGPAMGGGCGLAAACDFVFIAKEKGKIGAPEVRLGFLPALILIYLIKRMGEGRAREFVLRGDILDGVTAKERGLVSEIINDENLISAVNEFALQLAQTTSSSSVALTKDLFNRLNEMKLNEASEYAANLNALARKTEDFKKGIDAFLKKEKLKW